MQHSNVTVAQSDPAAADALTSLLRTHFKSVSPARSLAELLSAVPKRRADVVVVDLELADLTQLQALRRQFDHLIIVCTHRLADDGLWARALQAGADDCCHPADSQGILQAACRRLPLAQAGAA